MMAFYQLFVIFVVVASVVRVHGENEQCDLFEQLDKHYLEAAYLNQSGALYFNSTKMGEIKLNDPDESRQIAKVDAIRIDIKKFALLGYTERVAGEFKLIKMLVIEFGDNEITKSYNHAFPDDMLRLLRSDQAFYDKDENAIFVDENQRISIESGTFQSGRRGKEFCFMENIYCVYDPYTQQIKANNVSSHPISRILSTSCNLNVTVDNSSNESSKLFVSDGKENGSKFCLAADGEYQKIFLFPDFTKYDRNGCDNTTILTKP